MNKSGKISLTAAALIGCGSAAPAAPAATIVQTVTFGPQTGNWSLTGDLSPFDTALGTLTEVSAQISENATFTLDITNGGDTPITVSATPTYTLTSTIPGFSPFTISDSPAFNNLNLDANASTGPISSTSTGTSTFSTTNDLSAFESGPLTSTAVNTYSLSLTGSGGNLESDDSDSAEAIDQLTYTYTPTAVPEPSTWALIGSALSGLAFLRRRRKRT